MRPVPKPPAALEMTASASRREPPVVAGVLGTGTPTSLTARSSSRAAMRCSLPQNARSARSTTATSGSATSVAAASTPRRPSLAARREAALSWTGALRDGSARRAAPGARTRRAVRRCVSSWCCRTTTSGSPGLAARARPTRPRGSRSRGGPGARPTSTRRPACSGSWTASSGRQERPGQPRTRPRARPVASAWTASTRPRGAATTLTASSSACRRCRPHAERCKRPLGASLGVRPLPTRPRMARP
mmetsp:Transcript_8513/g.26476  ORF Transcript_8513/g.26476 Transcript_8513/m.26476 type:complete len:246 (+) Transcript_8513:393-1130(+)